MMPRDRLIHRLEEVCEVLLIILVALLLYFVPAYIGRRKSNSEAIFTLNLFFGWTIVGWMAAFVWAVRKRP